MTKLQSHSTSNPTSIAQKAAVEALRGPQDSVGAMLAEYRKRRDFVVAAAARHSRRDVRRAARSLLRLSELSGGARQERHRNTLQLAERLLAEAHVAVVPGEAFGTDQHVRISYATSMQELERGLDRIHQFIVKNS